jgi:DNA-binding MarR family transcriptional regulator
MYMEELKMSSGSEETHAELLEELACELRQFTGLGATFFRAAATRAGVTVTDIEVIEILDSVGPTTAGQLAELTGLTTGAITGMLNRLEEAGLVRRERDPNDGRRVIVQLVPGNDKMHEISAIFATLGTGWNEVVARYDDEQIALLLGFLKRGNELSRREITQLREAPSSGDETFSAPLGDLESGRLIFPTGAVRLILRADAGMAELYQARFEGPAPNVKVKDGTVTVRYSRRTWLLDWRQRTAEVTLSTAIPWRIEFRGGAAEITAELGGLDLVGLEIKGGMSALHLNLPTPSGVVPIRISGGAAKVAIERPAGVAVRVHLKGWAPAFLFDDQRFSNLGNDVRMQSSNYDGITPGYDIELTSSVASLSITSV